MTLMLNRLYDHMIWADERTADALESVSPCDPELLKLYAHLLSAEAVWLARIVGSEAPAVWPDLDLDECGTLAVRNHDAFLLLIDMLDEAGRAREVTYTNSKGDTFTNTVDEILHHVVMHGMYHRGQVMRGVRLSGGTPLPTDFIAYVRSHPTTDASA